MEYSQGRELWNTIAQKRNLSIHHGLKVINGWETVPSLKNINNAFVVANFLECWALSIRNGWADQEDQEKIEFIESLEKCSCEHSPSKHDYSFLRVEFVDQSNYDTVAYYLCHRCKGLEAIKTLKGEPAGIC